MKDTILIKREDGKTISVTAQQGEDGIIITKTGDKTVEAHKRKIIIETMEIDTYKKFIEAKIETNSVTGIFEYFRHFMK